MVYLTGDTHGDFSRVFDFCSGLETTLNDILVILGDAGFNYWGAKSSDTRKKLEVSKLPLTVFCVHGNHEIRPSNLDNYILQDWHGGQVWVEKDYPNIVFAKDGEVYDFEDKRAIVIGGAYSVDKYYRLSRGMNWFSDEQPSEEIKNEVEIKLANLNYTVDYVFSHTCPMRFEPVEWFIKGLDQSSVDKSTEIWLDKIYDRIKCNKWYCGHYHGNKEIENMKFLFQDICVLK